MVTKFAPASGHVFIGGMGAVAPMAAAGACAPPPGTRSTWLRAKGSTARPGQPLGLRFRHTALNRGEVVAYSQHSKHGSGVPHQKTPYRFHDSSRGTNSLRRPGKQPRSRLRIPSTLGFAFLLGRELLRFGVRMAVSFSFHSSARGNGQPRAVRPSGIPGHRGSRKARRVRPPMVITGRTCGVTCTGGPQ